MASPLRIASDTAILDVTKGRKALFKQVGFTPNGADKSAGKIPVTITGHIIGAWGNDDGESREFQVKVDNVKLGELVAP